MSREMANQLYTYAHQTIDPVPPMPPMSKTVLPFSYYSSINSTEPYLPDSSTFPGLGRARSNALTKYFSASSSAMYHHLSNTTAPHSGYSQLQQLHDTWPPAPGVELLHPGVKRSSEVLYDRTVLDAHNTIGQTEASYAMGYLTKRPRFESASHIPIYPQRPGEKDCTHYMQTRNCKFGDTCKFDHPIWVPEGGIPDWKEVLLPAADDLYPERPGALDCPYFMKTQRCKYGSMCKFNHPKERALTSGASRHPSTLPERPLEPPCAFYMKTGVCNFGATCKFHHPQDIQIPSAWQEKCGNELSGSAVRSEGTYSNKIAVAEGIVTYAQAMLHNSKGLPIRPGEVNCTFYQKTGSCKYGSTCRFSHPERTAAGITDPLVASTAENFNTAAVNPASSIYQTLDSRFVQPTVGTQTVYPQRPGQVECEYYIKTGECKFQERCKYHHPLNRSDLKSKQAAQQGVKLTLAGLPRREGEVHCPYYMKTGTCKYGATCKFDHPTPGEVLLTQVTSQATCQDGGKKEAGGVETQ